MSKNIRLKIDIVMIIILPMLMAYSLVGEMFHEIIGTIMLVLFIIHNVMNRRWYVSLLKGKYDKRRIFQTIINLSLLAFMIIQPISGILMSKHLYTFINLQGFSSIARTVHMFCAYWGYVLLCIHAGTHLSVPLERLKKSKEKVCKWMLVLGSLVSIYGVYSFVKRGFIEYLFMKTIFAFFDYGEPVVFFFLDYLSIMVLFMSVGYLATKFLGRKDNRKGIIYE